MPRLTRRQTLAASAALPAASLLPAAAQAEAPMLGPAQPMYQRFSLGAFEVTTLLVGANPVSDPQTIFGMNVSAEAFREVSEAAFLSAEAARILFLPTVVNTGDALILFDTGLPGGGITTALTAAGYSADQVDLVIVTHMHPDHIGGMTTDGVATFPNAVYATGRVEFDAWAGAENELFEAQVRPFAEQMQFLEDGDDAAPGITSVAAFGHTPGHMVYHLESAGQRLMLFADLANHPVWSLARPDWEVRFDMDKEAAAASRRRVLGMIAADRIPAIGYHMPFPGVGFVEVRGDGFHWVPESGQLMG